MTRVLHRPLHHIVLGLLLVFLASSGCENPTTSSQLAASLRLATTTSCENSGLLDVLLPQFQQAAGIEVEVLAVGTGRALRLAENGDVDAILVHAPEAEIAFMEAGFGVNRRSVMFNEFVVVGPAADPAGVGGANNAAHALAEIWRSGAQFVSRGDDSGTHMKELAIWQAASVTPSSGEQYLEAGQGMAATLRMANELQAYCLTDIATFLTYAGDLTLEVIVEGDPLLRNPYSVIAVNPQRHAEARYLEAMLFIGWLTSPEAGELIGTFESHGRRLFTFDP